MRVSRAAVLISVCVLTLLLTPKPASGQQSPTGLDQFGTFHRNHIQTMNLFNLNNHIEIPLFTKKERGVNFYAKLVWDQSDALTFYQAPYPPGGQYFEVSSGPRLATVTDVYYNSHLLGSQTCSVNNGAVTTYFDSIVDQNNTVHPLPVGSSVGPTGQYCGSGTWSRATNDGKWLLTVSWTDQNCWGEQCITSVTMTDTSGDVFGGNAALTDPNGNQITASSSGWTDATGNTVFKAQQLAPPSPNVQYSYPIQTGGMANVQLNFTSGFTLQNNFGCSLPYLNSTATLPTSVSLPDGTSYSFVYESANGSYPSSTVTGRIHSITAPAGGTWTYTYSGGNNGINCYGTPGSPATITITASDGSAWTYNRTVCASNCTTQPWSQTVVTDPACNDTIYSFDALGEQMQVQNYQGTAGTAACSATTKTLLQTVTTCYNGDFTNCGTVPSNGTCSNPGGPCRVDTYTYLPSLGQSSLSEVFYNSTELPTQDNEFDFGVNTGSAPTTTPLRSTLTAYASIGSNILNRPSCVQVTGGTAPSTCGTVTSNTKSITNYLNYDSHGNVGTIQKWVSGSTYVSQNFTYYSTGLVHTATDFKSNQTTYTYGACNNSYLTSAVNPLSQSSSMAWDCNGGVVTSTTDENSQTTNYSYTNPSNGVADPFWRLTRTTFPDTGQTTITYNDTANPANVTTSRLMDNSGHSITTQTNFDGFGRPIQNIVTSDPDCAGGNKTDTTYDLFNRVHTVSNPYCSTGDPTYGLTTYVYDPLGRTCLVIPPDGTAATTCPSTQPANDIFTTYSGNCFTVADQAGKSRKSCSDGLGRLTQVFEDPATLNYETDYTYDALDNLLTVNQKGGTTNSALWRTRTFAYDSLSRLTSATNPESGAITYTYDPNGNLTSKTSPAPNQTGSATITMSYCYDALNRMTSKAYIAQSCPMSSPVATYSYDQSSFNGLAIVNGIGRRTGMTDQAGSEAWSFDPMGRVATDRRTTNGVTFSTPYTYNLDGSMASEIYPDKTSPQTVTFQQGGAGRPLSEALSNGTSPYAYNAHYTPSGALCHLNAASGNTFTHFWTYNNRLQPVQIQLYGTGFGSSPSPCTASTDGAGYNVFLTYSFVDANGHNNGNVTSVVNTMDYNMGGTTVSYTYDSLNRLASAQTTGTNQPQYQGDTDYLSECWTEQYSYDPWGNLLSIAPNGSSSYTGCMQESGFDYTNSTNTKNQITYTGFSYDAAGNLMTPPGVGTVTFDAENRIVSAGGVNYTYDGDGKRVMKNPGKIYWYNTQGEMIVETDLSGNPLFRHYYFYGVHVSRYEVQRGFVDHYGLDHLGNTRFLYNDSSGNPGWDTSDFYPFGGERVYDSTSNNQFKFTGKERDSESGLDYFGARYNSSSFGRFLSPDPENAGADAGDPQSWNAYAYVMNNPLNSVDPDGLCGGPPGSVSFTIGETTSKTEIFSAPCIDGSSFSWRTFLQEAGNAAQKANDYLHAAYKAVVNSRAACTAAYTAAGAVAGASVGAEAGATVGTGVGALGFAGGPTGLVTTPAGTGLGGLIGGAAGGIGGGALGYNTGLALCSSGTGSGGGSSSSGSGSGGSGGRKWKFGSNKSASKWAAQMKQRGWTDAQIDEAINHGQQYPAPNNINPANGATRFVNPTTGQSVVVDNVTGEVIHVGGPGFTY